MRYLRVKIFKQIIDNGSVACCRLLKIKGGLSITKVFLALDQG